MGRFLGDDKTAEYDRSAGVFHLERAVDCGVTEAIVTLADICLGRPHDLLTDVQVRRRTGTGDGDWVGDGIVGRSIPLSVRMDFQVNG